MAPPTNLATKPKPELLIDLGEPFRLHQVDQQKWKQSSWYMPAIVPTLKPYGTPERSLYVPAIAPLPGLSYVKDECGSHGSGGVGTLPTTAYTHGSSIYRLREMDSDFKTQGSRILNPTGFMLGHGRKDTDPFVGPGDTSKFLGPTMAQNNKYSTLHLPLPPSNYGLKILPATTSQVRDQLHPVHPRFISTARAEFASHLPDSSMQHKYTDSSGNRIMPEAQKAIREE